MGRNLKLEGPRQFVAHTAAVRVFPPLSCKFCSENTIAEARVNQSRTGDRAEMFESIADHACTLY